MFENRHNIIQKLNKKRVKKCSSYSNHLGHCNLKLNLLYCCLPFDKRIPHKLCLTSVSHLPTIGKLKDTYVTTFITTSEALI